MRKKSKLKKEKILDRLLEVPKEISTNEPKITIAGFKQMLIENYKIILEPNRNLTDEWIEYDQVKWELDESLQKLVNTLLEEDK